LLIVRVAQKLFSGNGPFPHILCSFLRAIRRYIERPEQARRNKNNVPNFCRGMLIESRATLMTECADTQLSLVGRRVKVDFREAKVPF